MPTDFNLTIEDLENGLSTEQTAWFDAQVEEITIYSSLMYAIDLAEEKEIA